MEYIHRNHSYKKNGKYEKRGFPNDPNKNTLYLNGNSVYDNEFGNKMLKYKFTKGYAVKQFTTNQVDEFIHNNRKKYIRVLCLNDGECTIYDTKISSINYREKCLYLNIS